MSMTVQTVEQTIAVIKYNNVFLCCIVKGFETQRGLHDFWSILH